MCDRQTTGWLCLFYWRGRFTKTQDSSSTRPNVNLYPKLLLLRTVLCFQVQVKNFLRSFPLAFLRHKKFRENLGALKHFWRHEKRVCKCKNCNPLIIISALSAELCCGSPSLLFFWLLFTLIVQLISLHREKNFCLLSLFFLFGFYGLSLLRSFL